MTSDTENISDAIINKRKWLHNTFVKMYRFLLLPKSHNEDSRRREFILNVILLSSILFVGFLDFTILVNTITNDKYSGVPFGIFSLVLVLFVAMYVLSRWGYFIVASYLFVAFYFVVTSYSSYRWGTYLPSSLLNFVLLIIISSILLGTKFGFVVTGVISITLGIIGYREVSHGVDFATFWQDKVYRFNDVLEFIITFFVIMTISWLSNREIEKSLIRARKSEADLAEERDNLEITVQQRTQKLRELQTARVTELHRLAESGRQAAGFFHDLMNPLTAIAMSVQDLKNKAPVMAENVQSSLDQAISASKRMENFIQAIRKQSKSEEEDCLFSLNNEIEQAVLLLQHKAKREDVHINFVFLCQITGMGKPQQFYQIISNLLSNAIESYEGSELKNKVVEIKLYSESDSVIIKVSDQGKGIPAEMQSKIFDNFFTTKTETGMGLGLAITKNIIEKELSGHINVISSNTGTVFFVVFPCNDKYTIEDKTPITSYSA